MQYTTLREQPKPPKPPQIRRPDTPERPKAKSKPKPARRCPSGFRWDSKRGRCVQAGVGPQYQP